MKKLISLFLLCALVCCFVCGCSTLTELNLTELKDKVDQISDTIISLIPKDEPETDTVKPGDDVTEKPDNKEENETPEETVPDPFLTLPTAWVPPNRCRKHRSGTR